MIAKSQLFVLKWPGSTLREVREVMATSINSIFWGEK